MMEELVSYLTPILASGFGLVVAFRTRPSWHTRWFAFAMICAAAASVLVLVYGPPLQLSLRAVIGTAALICGFSAGVQIERSRSAARLASQRAT